MRSAPLPRTLARLARTAALLACDVTFGCGCPVRRAVTDSAVAAVERDGRLIGHGAGVFAVRAVAPHRRR